MRKLLVLLLFLPLMATAKIPVEEDIIRQTLDSESPYYYPNLMLRYQSGDDSMTEEDYHYLYYGYAYQDAYKPLNANSDMDKAILIAQTVDFENPTHESLEKLIAAVNDALVQDPFSARRLEERTDQLQPDELHPGDDRGFRQRPQGRERLAYPDVRTCSRSAGRTRPSLRQSTRRQAGTPMDFRAPKPIGQDIGADYECVGWSEIDKWAIKAHNAVFPELADRNYGDITKIDWNAVPNFDLFTYSFPCTDISSAGEQKGFNEDSGTRSSLLWNAVGRLRPSVLNSW